MITSEPSVHEPLRASHSSQRRPLLAAPLWRYALRVLRARRRQAAAIAVGLLVAGVVVILVVPRRYTSSGSFVVEAAPSAGAMGGAMAIISQLNPNLAGGDSPKFYVDLIESRPVLESLLALVPRASCSTHGQASVLETFKIPGKTEVERRANGVALLRNRIGSGYDLRTGVISLSIEAPCPELARELADSLIASINTFNVDRRRTRAKLRREFAEQRAREADSSLRAAEEALSEFQAGNRIVTTPRLALESDRLRRRVTEREDLATSLEREASSARLDEINSIPALTVIETPDLPVRASYPKRRVWAVLLIFVAVVTASAFVLLRFVLGAAPRDHESELSDAHARLRAASGLRARAGV